MRNPWEVLRSLEYGCGSYLPKALNPEAQNKAGEGTRPSVIRSDLEPRSLRIRRQVWRPWRQLLRVRLNFFHYQFDGLFKLWILAFDHEVRSVFHHDIGLHSPVLNDP